MAFLDEIKDKASDLVEDAKEAVDKAKDKVEASGLVDKVKDGAGDLASKVKSGATDLVDKVKDFADGDKDGDGSWVDKPQPPTPAAPPASDAAAA